MDLVLQNFEDKSIYCRSIHKEGIALCEFLEKCYGHKSIVVPSGMCAISVALQTILLENKATKINIIYGNELYCDTPRLLKYLSKIYMFSLYAIDVTNTDALMNLFQSDIKNDFNIFLLESCTNPNGDIFDFEQIKQLRKLSKKLCIIVDNTWLTHVIFNPFKYDADIVVTSLTKYYSAGQCIAGAIVSKKKLFSKLFDFVRINGIHVSPIYCQMVYEAMQTITERMVYTSGITTKIIDFLSTNDKIIIKHPYIKPIYANNFFTMIDNKIIYPSVIAIYVPMSKENTIQWMKSMKINYETSYGSKESRFDPWPQQIDDNNTMCRLAIGYEDTFERLYDELKEKINF